MNSKGFSSEFCNPFLHRPWMVDKGAAATPASGNKGIKGIIAGITCHNFEFCLLYGGIYGPLFITRSYTYLF